MTLDNVRIEGSFSQPGLWVNGANVTINGEGTLIHKPASISIDTSSRTADTPSVLTINAGEFGKIGNQVYDNGTRSRQEISILGSEIDGIAAQFAGDVVNISGGDVITQPYGYVGPNVSSRPTKLTTSAASEFVKYDLNRDGKIDSIDVAYVLVSWGE